MARFLRFSPGVETVCELIKAESIQQRFMGVRVTLQRREFQAAAGKSRKILIVGYNLGEVTRRETVAFHKGDQSFRKMQTE